MRHGTCVSAIVLALGIATESARCAEPDPTKCIVPDFIDLVGMHDGVADPFGLFTVTVRDANGLKIPGAPVSVDFSGCPEFFPSAVQPYPGLSMSCATRTVSAIADGNGVASFVIVGSVLHRSTATTTACAEVRAGESNVVLKQVKVASYDLDGVNGVDSHDVSLWCENFLRDLVTVPSSDRSGAGVP